MVEDVVHLRPEEQLPLFGLEREALGERHIPVVHTRARDRQQLARPGVTEARHVLTDAQARIGLRRQAARQRDLERRVIEERVARRAVHSDVGIRRPALERYLIARQVRVADEQQARAFARSAGSVRQREVGRVGVGEVDGRIGGPDIRLDLGHTGYFPIVRHPLQGLYVQDLGQIRRLVHVGENRPPRRAAGV